jgi:iron complex outermembrane receptor protein
MNKTGSAAAVAIALGTAVTGLGLPVAQAQQSAGADGSETRGQSTLALETVVVTAQKKAENAQDVPISISVFGADALEASGVTRLADFIAQAPNVYINFNDSIRATAISVRGILSDPNSVGIDPSVGVYVDGVYMARPTTVNTAMYDLERVEVLRGPQGTIFGKNTIGGAMSFVSKLPTDQAEVSLGLDYGNFNAATVTLIGNTPKIGDSLAIRGAVQYQQRDGLLENLAGPDNNDVNNINARISALYDVSDTLSLILRADAARDRTHDGANEILVPSPLYARAPFNSPQDVNPWDRVINDSPSAFQDRDLWGISAEANWRVSGGTFTSITAYRAFDWNNFQSSNKSAFDIFGTGIKEDQSQLSQELRFAGNAGDRLNYLLGVYYDQQEMDAEAWARVGKDVFAVFGLPLGSNPTPGVGYIDIGLESESYAGFGQLEVRATDRLKLIAGLRYTSEEKSISHQLFADPTGQFVPNTPRVTDSRTDEEATWLTSATWSFSDDVVGYVTYSHGFKSGGYNAFSFSLLQADGTLAEFDPEYVDNYEVGVKTTLLDGRLRLNADVFYMDYQDLQVNQLIQNAQGIINYQTSNAAKAISKGGELEIMARLAAGLDVTLGYGYTDASYDSFRGATPAGADFSGNTLPQSPKHSLSATTQYLYPVSEQWNFLGRAEYTYRSERYSDAANSPQIMGDSYGLVNLRLGVEEASGGMSLTLWARNLLDKDYAVVRGFGSSAFAPGAIGQSVGNERMYGIEYRYRWRAQ